MHVYSWSVSICLCGLCGVKCSLVVFGWFGVCLPTTYICKLEFLTIIDTGYSDFTLGYVKVVVNVIGEEAHVCIHIVGEKNFFGLARRTELML